MEVSSIFMNIARRSGSMGGQPSRPRVFDSLHTLRGQESPVHLCSCLMSINLLYFP